MKIEELINKHYQELNETDLHILKYILNCKDTCYKLGINDLAEECNVSRSSILRLAQKLGFSGFSEFRVFLKWQDQKEFLPNENEVDVLEKDILETLKYIKEKDFSEICKLLYQSDRIFAYGTGMAQTNCAMDLKRMFLPMKKYIYVIPAQKELDIVLSDITTNDVMIIISLSGDTPYIFPSVQFLITKGVPIISITNLKNNRLARMTPYNIYANSSKTEILNDIIIETFASFFVISEALFKHYVEYVKKIGQKDLKDI
ncbi:MurR/RpiR family transcriptional regulator [Garciella nitratireducens]|uniref:Transcriptional regulator, RpiR family n=1 Tax=Garciella nitratireducens DSM 15102 TaxID=1121911 RepID=A0A1T4KGU1_9FIRM|nr:MurR/RpiR family transcriptional regulator [Garciella nitratireducens]SJZ41649.1 transcriptional regulator, RpiR family [Garciella nitratireducens DSM 15102]